MTTARYLFIFVLSWILIDACRDGRSSTDKTQTKLRDTPDLAGQHNLCDPSERNYELPTLGLPKGSTIALDTLVPFLQNKANKLSWMTFIAMNWRANEDGTPDSSQCFGARDGVTVWEHWMPGPELFRVDNQLPRPWKYGTTATGHPKNSTDNPKFRYFKLNELSQFDPDREVLPNQYGDNTLYEVYYNRQIYDYIIGGELYSIAGQRKFVKKWPRQANGLYMLSDGKNQDTISLEKFVGRPYLPVGSPKDTSFTYRNDTISGQMHYYKSIGSIMVKSAWMILTPAQNAAHYHIRVVRLNGKQVTLGLVALHIAHKLAEAPRWMWSTFEHIRNTPAVDEKGVATLQPGVDYLYFDETRNDTSTYNKLPKSVNGKSTDQKAIQAVTVQKRAQATDQINDQFHNLIRQANKQSVWLNYRLVGTQWPYNDPDPLRVNGPMEPALLANSMLETYHQPTSSCMGCHYKARILSSPSQVSQTKSYFADFVWGMALGTDSTIKMHTYTN